MSDRIFGGIVLTMSLLMMWATTLIEESFIQDPLGPKAFPLVIAGVMAISAVVMFFKPDGEPEWPGLYKVLELVATVGVFIAYAQMLPIAGFVVATVFATAFLVWRLGGTPRQAGVGGIAIAVGIYLVFHFMLGLNLAKGPWGF
ncbi:tripartite tricarboxylate transporter TctB family protein [Hydrogenophaga sp.]|uniref:tripartite tricarboxylate transporter TctB family protein n=1 Tax=Hydrogenophaga sp. TaxID=1904254 RepID=UPI00271B6F8E|nr:tripartite tricarboxylate transporter TctB family protein [Hydrogenophaga sp.]MDO8903832.1 tripartite tricarboxylate transporter TctB family protein [Hydrogenophaga sp.]